MHQDKNLANSHCRKSSKAMLDVAFITRFFENPTGGVGKYERSLFSILENSNEIIKRVPIKPYQFPDWAIKAAALFRKDLVTFAHNFPYCIEPGYSLVHLSNEILGFALLFHHGKSIITVHHLPNLWSAQFRQEIGSLWWLYLFAIIGIRRANRVIVDSKWIKNQVSSYLKIPCNRIDVIPLSVDHSSFYPKKNVSEIRHKYQLGNGPHILYVGGMDERKNLPVLFKAYSKLIEFIPDTELILVGPEERGINKLQDSAGVETNNYRFLGFVPTEDLIKLYNLATIFVMPSKLEGFGLPVLEAMACGCPVIVSNAAALPEVAGPAGIYFDPDDVEALVNSMKRVILNSDLQKKLSELSIKQASLFDWQTTANLTIASYYRTILQSVEG